MNARVEILDPRGAGLVAAGAQPERIWTGAKWAEGPLVLPWDGSLIFSDIPNNRIMRIAADGTAAVWKEPSNFANGRTLDAAGDIITCEHGGRRVSRTRRDGSYDVVVDRHDGRRLNSPNDVVVATDGAIWFTDPPYGIESDYEGYKADSEQSGNHVYRFDPATGRTIIAADDFDRPNGLAFSHDGRLLYVADSGASRGAAYGDEAFVPSRPHNIRVFDVAAGGRLTGDRVFAVIDAGVPDGLRVDAAGNVWTSAWDGVRVHAPDGTMLVKVHLPEMVSNLCFDPTATAIYVTATSSIYRLALGG